MNIPEEWTVKSLSDVVEIQRGFDLPHDARRPGPYPVLTAGETGGFHDEGPIKGPGVTIGRATNLGKPKWSNVDFWPHNTTMFVKDFKGNSRRWVYHLFEATDLSGFDSGSVQPMLNRNYIAHVQVRVPPFQEQVAIAEVLGALDEKIAANTKLATSATSLAFHLFDGSLVDTEKILRRLDEVAIHRPGKYLAKNDYDTSGEYYVYGSNSVMGKHTEYLVEGAFTVLAKIGSYCGNLRWSQKPAWVNNNASAIVARDSIDPWVLGQALLRVDMHQHRAGTGQPYIRMDSLFSSHVTIPNEESSRQLAPKLRELAEVSTKYIEESESLAQIRDTLLPPLMAGKLRVKEAGEILAAAV